MLKEAFYPNLNADFSTVVYAIIGNTCVFTKKGRRGTSTINAAESIIFAICIKERMDPRSGLFYDLSTCQEYSHLQPGEFEFAQIHFRLEENQPVQPSWDTRQTCPSKIVKLFKQYIGPDPQQVNFVA